MLGTEGTPKKREASQEPGSDSPASKRARFDAATSADGVGLGNAIPNYLNTPATSAPRSVVSAAETTMTSASTSKRPKKYLCDYPDCGKAFDRPVRLETHKRSHTNERPFICPEMDCDKTFLRNEHLVRHIKDKHEEERNFFCTYLVHGDNGETECGRTFTTAARLKRHIAAHEEKEQTKCPEPGCGKVFRKQETLQRHIKKDHLHENAFTCTHTITNEGGMSEECGEAFPTVGQLKGHVSREHSRPKFFCEICPELESLGQLDNSSAMNERHAETSVAGTYRVVFPSHAELQLHIKTFHPPSCPDCGKVCESNRAVKAHQDIEHSSLPERQQFKCTWQGCNRGFTKAGNLKVHIQTVHAKIKKFVCGDFDMTGNPKVEGWNREGCGLGFGTKSNLEEHIRTQHLGLPNKMRPNRLKKMVKFEEGSTSSTLMDVDEAPTPAGDDRELAMLTGFGYENSRHIGCLVGGCQFRFMRDYDLAQHLELKHGWNVDDVNESIAERDALAGKDFWIGGGTNADTAAEEELRTQLCNSLNIAEMNNGNLPAMKDTAAEPVDPMLDPALSGN